jgi:hypothetical protein
VTVLKATMLVILDGARPVRHGLDTRSTVARYEPTTSVLDVGFLGWHGSYTEACTETWSAHAITSRRMLFS